MLSVIGVPPFRPSIIPLSICKGVVLAQIALRNSSFYRLETKQTLSSLGQKSFIEKDVFSFYYTSDSEEKKPSTLSRRRTYDLLVTSPDAQPLSYRRLVRTAKAPSLLLKTVQWRYRWRWCIRWFRCGYPSINESLIALNFRSTFNFWNGKLTFSLVKPVFI